MADISTNALIIGSGLPSSGNAELQEANKQWTEYYIHQAKVLKIISELPKPLQDAMIYTEAFGMAMESLFGGFNTLCETIENAHKIIEKVFKSLGTGPKLDIKDVKFSIDCDSLRKAVQNCLDKSCFKICCECVCGSSRSSSGGSSSGAPGGSSGSGSSSGSGILSFLDKPPGGWLGQTLISSALGSSMSSFAWPIVGRKVGPKINNVRERFELKSKTSGHQSKFSFKDGESGWGSSKSSRGRFSGLKSGFGSARSRLGNTFKNSSFLRDERGSLFPGRPSNSRTPKMRGKAGILSRAGGLLGGGLGKGAGMLGKIGGLGLRALGPIGLIASGGMAAFDGYNKWNELKGKGASNWTALKGAAWTGLDSFTMGGASAVAGMIPQSWKNTAGNMLGGVDKALGGIVNNPGQITKSISNLVNQAVSALKSLPGRAASAVMGLGGKIGGTISKAMSTAGKYVTNGINQIVKFFRLLPGRAASAIMGLGGRIWGIISGVMSTAGKYVTNGINQIVGFFKSLPKSAASAIGGLTGAIGGRISGALSSAKSIASKGISMVVNAFWTLPGRISGALSSMYNTVVTWINNTLGPLKKLYCMVAGCSPGIIPAFKSMAQEVPKQIGSTMPHIEKFANSLNKVPSNVKIDAVSGNSTTGSSRGNVVVQKGAIVVEGPVYGITDLEKKMEKVTLKVLDRETTFY